MTISRFGALANTRDNYKPDRRPEEHGKSMGTHDLAATKSKILKR